MKSTLVVVAVLAAFPVAAQETGKAYGKAGVISLGGDLDLSSGSTTFKFDGIPGESTTETTDLEIGPRASYFVIDGLELIGGVSLLSETSEYEDGSTESDVGYTLQVGGAYLINLGSLHVGPQLGVGFASTTHNEEDEDGNKLDFSVGGPAVFGSLELRIPFGTGGVFGFGLGVTHLPWTISGDIDGEYTATSFGVSNSIAVFF